MSRAPKLQFQVIINASFRPNSSIYPFINYLLLSVHKAVHANWEWHLIITFLAGVLEDPEAHRDVKTTASSCAYIRANACISCLSVSLWGLEEIRKNLLEGCPGKATLEADCMCITHALQLCLFYKA